MLIAHEAPISILEDIRNVTDIQYALVHLFDTHPEYYSFFKSSLLLGREVLLDNSIFELKEAFDSDRYAKYIEELKPTYYIVPDVLEDCVGTINKMMEFTSKYKKLPGLKIGAVQGKSYDELVECYKMVSHYADYIAISFDYSWYQHIGLSTSTDKDIAKLERMCTGRTKLIEMLQRDNIWRHDKPHHLLGCSLAKEFKAYKNMPSIRSVDTSNPVVAGILGQRYIKGLGLQNKSSIMLASLIDHKVTNEQTTDIVYNVYAFRDLCLS